MGSRGQVDKINAGSSRRLQIGTHLVHSAIEELCPMIYESETNPDREEL